MKALQHAAWGLLLWLPATAAEDPKVNHSTPVDPALLAQEPYRQTGLVFGNGVRGSGFVASHPNLFFTAAHVVYLPQNEAPEGQADALLGWQPPPMWIGGYSDFAMPPLDDGMLSRGYFRWTLYSDLAEEYRQNSNMAFSRDVALAWGLEPFIEGTPAVLDTRGANKLRAGATSMITGYPASIPYTDEDGNYFLHSTTPESIPYRLERDSYVFADLISTGPGNSGGPVWIQNSDTTWSAAGVLVSGLAGEAGVYGMSPEIKRMLKAAEPALGTPLQRVRHVSGVGLSTALLALPRAKTIPDGVKRWTIIQFDINDFPEDAVVAGGTVNLNISTTHRGDLIVMLLAPGGFSQELFNQEGADEDDVVLDDVPLAFGTEEEEDFPRANGRWQLLVQDRLRGDVATITRFELFLPAYLPTEN